MTDTTTVTPPATVTPAANPATAVIPPNPTAATENARMTRIREAMKPAATPPVAAPEVKTEAPVVVAKTEAVKLEAAPSLFEKKEAVVAVATEAADLVDTMKLASNASPESVVRFSELAKVAKERKAEADNARRELAAANERFSKVSAATPAEAAEIERLRTEHKQLSDQMAITNLQNHPDFNRQFIEPKKKALAVASEVIQYNGKEAPELATLLGRPMKEFNAAISELTKDMNSADASTVVQSLRQARELQAGEAQALSKSGELQEQIRSKSALEAKRAFEAVAGEVLPAISKRPITDAMTAEQREEALNYNAAVDGLRAKAEKRAFGTVGERDVATMAFKEAAYDHLVTHGAPLLERHIQSQAQLIADLTTQLQALKGNKGPANIGASTGGIGGVDTSKMTREQRVHHALHGSQRSPGA